MYALIIIRREGQESREGDLDGAYGLGVEYWGEIGKVLEVQFYRALE